MTGCLQGASMRCSFEALICGEGCGEFERDGCSRLKAMGLSKRRMREQIRQSSKQASSSVAAVLVLHFCHQKSFRSPTQDSSLVRTGALQMRIQPLSELPSFLNCRKKR